MRESRVRCRARVGAVLAAATSAGCATVFHDQAEVPGTGQRLVVGAKQAPFGWDPVIWVLEEGAFVEVEVVER